MAVPEPPPQLLAATAPPAPKLPKTDGRSLAPRDLFECDIRERLARHNFLLPRGDRLNKKGLQAQFKLLAASWRHDIATRQRYMERSRLLRERRRMKQLRQLDALDKLLAKETNPVIRNILESRKDPSLLDDSLVAMKKLIERKALYHNRANIRAWKKRNGRAANLSDVRVVTALDAEWNSMSNGDKRLWNDAIDSLKGYQTHLINMGAQVGSYIPEFLREPLAPHNDVYWTKSEHIGEGAYGKAALLVALDANENVIDRCVMKTVSARAFHKKPFENRLIDESLNLGPREARMHRIVNRANCANIIGLRAVEVSEHQDEYYLFMEWAPFGDLKSLIRHIQTLNAPENQNPVGPIPEAALWSIFINLLGAGCAMVNGAVPPMSKSATNSQPGVVHLDIKPGNILVSDPQPDSDFPEYPRMVLGDFGVAHFEREGVTYGGIEILKSLGGSLQGRAVGTPRWRGPEQSSIQTAINSQWDVYAIGLVMFALVENRQTIPALSFEKTIADRDAATKHSFSHEATERYSNALLMLIEQCWADIKDSSSEHKSPGRPTFPQLQQMVKKAIKLLKKARQRTGLPLGMMGGGADKDQLHFDRYERVVVGRPYLRDLRIIL